jgi:hypothetical protein
MSELQQIMQERAKVIEEEMAATLRKNKINEDLRKLLIEEKLYEFFKIDFESLFRMTNTEPDKHIKRRMHERFWIC